MDGLPLSFGPVEESFGPGEMIAKKHQPYKNERNSGARNQGQRKNNSDEQSREAEEYSKVLRHAYSRGRSG